MSARTRAIIGVAIMSVLLALYFVLAGVRAIALLQSGHVIAVLMGVALIVLPLLGIWALLREIRFGFSATKLTDELAAADQIPEELTEETEHGLQLRERADEIFPRYRDAAEATPEDWRAWQRLALVYDAAGDRKRARSAIRQAIAVKRHEIS